jgi:hypothetical protein
VRGESGSAKKHSNEAGASQMVELRRTLTGRIGYFIDMRDDIDTLVAEIHKRSINLQQELQRSLVGKTEFS